MKDTIYTERMHQIPDFCFDKQVADVFDDMISRSVPMYAQTQEVTALLARYIAQENTNIYDLGCSTGTTLVAVAKELSHLQINIQGIDSSQAMINESEKKITDNGLGDKITLAKSNILDTDYNNASIVISNYTLQFIPVQKRLELLKSIYKGLNKGGALILSEKVCHNSKRFDELMINIHHDLKKLNGYSQMEIAQKREAIKNILIPNTIEENINLLKNAGFDDIDLVVKCYNFSTLLAIK